MVKVRLLDCIYSFGDKLSNTGHLLNARYDRHCELYFITGLELHTTGLFTEKELVCDDFEYVLEPHEVEVVS